MLHLHYWPTPNGHKITMFLEESGLPYEIIPVNIGRGEQFKPEYLAISPNNKMPALVDDEPEDGQGPFSLFESGAILHYLAEKSSRFLPRGLRDRHEADAWLFWQVGGLGPMVGQYHHFKSFAPAPDAYTLERYANEVTRLYHVLDKRLAGREFLAKDYSIADMAVYPWAKPGDESAVEIADFPHVSAWLTRVGDRPATKRAYAIGDRFKTSKSLDDEARKNLFGKAQIEAHAAH